MKLSFRQALLLYMLLPIAVIFLVFAGENIYKTRKDVHERIEDHMTDLAYSFAGLFNEILKPVAGSARTLAVLAENKPGMEEQEAYRLLEMQVRNNPVVYGAWLIYAPYQFDKSRKLFGPYVFHQGGALQRMDAATRFDYTTAEHEYWSKPVAAGKGVWTEPYFDDDAGNIMMSSYAVPFYRDGQLIGVAGVDIPLHEISNNIHIPGVRKNELTVLSDTGKIILYHDWKRIGKSIFDVIEDDFNTARKFSGGDGEEALVDDRKAIDEVSRLMMSGETGKAELTTLDEREDYWYFFAPIKSPGWSIALRVRESEVFASVYSRYLYSVVFFALLLALVILAIFLVSGKLSRTFGWLTDRCQRIERMNFQTYDDMKFRIAEVRQLSATLDRMSGALNSHFSKNEDSRIALAIREQTLPTKLRHPPGYQLSVWSNVNPATCGETYDTVDYWRSSYSAAKELLGQRPEGTAYLLIDSPDKGIDAVVKNTHLRAIFSSYSKLGVDLLDTVRCMNDYLISDLHLPGPVQAWLGVIDHQDHTLTSISLGLNTVLHFSAEHQQLKELPNYPFALSLHKEMPEIALQEHSIQPGDLLIIASFGVIGALNPGREQFGRERLERIILEHSSADAKTVSDAIKVALENFTAGEIETADSTVLVIKRSN